MASITIASGKAALYRNSSADGASPFINILSVDDGAWCPLIDSTGRPWVFRIYNAKLQFKRSTDTDGDTWDAAWTDIVASAVKDGTPSAETLATGRIEVTFWKTDDKWYRAYTDNSSTWTVEEIAT